MKTIMAALTLALCANSYAEQGGVVSGGGGTLPADPVSRWTVEYTAKNSKAILSLLFNGLESPTALSTQPALRKKLFDGPVTIHEVIKSTGVYVADEGPCYDAEGHPSDGSIFAPVAKQICISSFTISQKLPESEAIPQILALLVHEYSHLLGADEMEAENLQRYVSIALKGTGFDNGRFNQLQLSIYGDSSLASFLLKDIQKLIADLPDLGADQRNAALNGILQDYSRFNEALFNRYPFDGLPAAGRTVDRGFGARLVTTLWKIHSLSTDGDAAYWGQIYEETFQGDPAVDLNTWHRRHFHDEDDQRSTPGFSIRNIRSEDDLKSELRLLENEAQMLVRHVHDTLFAD